MGAFVPPPGQPNPLQQGEFVSASTPYQVTLDTKHMAMDGYLYVRPEDFLRLGVNNSSAAVTSVRLTWRTITPDGIVHVGTQDLAVPADSSTQSFFVQLPEGWLLSARVGCLALNQRGQTFVRLELARASGANLSTSSDLLCQGYTGLGFDIGYPGGPQLASVDGPGAIISQQQANPAAGADWIYTVPASHRQRVQSLHAVFTASATVGNRNVDLTVDDGANLVWVASLPTAITASQVIDVVSTGTNSPTGVVTSILSLVSPPGMVLSAGMRIKTITGGIVAGDQWSTIFLLLEDWLAI